MDDDFFAQLTAARDAQRDPEPAAAEEVPFQVFRGPKGEPGEPGPAGRDGVDGRDGRDGVDGRDGQDGAAGPRGLQGPPGMRGPEGRQGPPGQDGRPAPYVVNSRVERDRAGRISTVIEHLNDGSQRVRMVERDSNGRPTGLTLKG